MVKETTLPAPSHDPRHIRYALAVNTVLASMKLDSRTLMTANDAQRVAQIFALLHLDKIIERETERGTVEAPEQPPADPRLADIERRLAESLEVVDSALVPRGQTPS